ncbi:MAG: transporter-like protein, antibiotic transport system ATP-binding protein [Candidatus Berkelbacteria bacterium]|nr:transporter-like protein, antibiotic transport system ATP-binding protein [Candidatus Berkelbacteria bacterium]
MKNVIEVKNLTKKYGSLEAVKNISFEVQQGEIFGLLGENGAGKTTTLEMIEGLRKPTSGQINVLGKDAYRELNQIKEKIGVQLQSSAYFDDLKLREILELFGSFYRMSLYPSSLLKMVNLQDKANSTIKNLSGGQRQRFSIVAALVNDPQIVFLDEPTTGLDPIARRNLWDIIAKIKKQGKTIILTTHYMEEAENLCDRVAIMDKGEIVAIDKPHKLVESLDNPFKVEFVLQENNPALLENIMRLCNARECDIKTLPGKTAHYEIKLQSQQSLNSALDLVQKEKPESIKVGSATLEDAFIGLTGKSIQDEENGNG